MKGVLLTVGDELLIGQVTNTNSAWLGEQLTLRGIDVVRAVTVGDEEEVIVEALREAFATAELVLCTGGLGPTHDDLTRQALARFFDAPLEVDPSVLDEIRARFERRGRRMPESNRVQAMVPRGFEVLPNPVGTAPGLWYESEEGGRKLLLAVLPGVPFEMRTLVEQEVMPRLHSHKDVHVLGHRTLLTVGIGESDLQEVIGDLSDYLSPKLRLAYLPSTAGVRLRITAFADDPDEVEAQLDRFEARLRAAAERYIYGRGGDTLESVVGGLLRERGLTIAFAESCTGGLAMNQVTNVSGASGYVLGGVVAYSNVVKVHQLGVDAETLEREGAVSEAVALQMARNVRERLGADIGVSTTGIAGPTGGTVDKPVGTVWIAYADGEGERAVLLRLFQDRVLNKELTVTALLNLVRRRLLQMAD